MRGFPTKRESAALRIRELFEAGPELELTPEEVLERISVRNPGHDFTLATVRIALGDLKRKGLLRRFKPYKRWVYHTPYGPGL